jgi:hypothetical protein
MASYRWQFYFDRVVCNRVLSVHYNVLKTVNKIELVFRLKMNYFVLQILSVLLLECSTALGWEPSYWLQYLWTNERLPRKQLVSHCQSCAAFQKGHSKLRRQPSDILKRQFINKWHPSNKRRPFWNSYSCGSINQCLKKVLRSKHICSPQSELCCILKVGQSELRRQQSEIPKRHFQSIRLPSNKNFYLCGLLFSIKIRFWEVFIFLLSFGSMPM